MVADPRFKLWVNRQLYGISVTEGKVRDDMRPQNIRVEVKKDGRWVPE